MSKSNIFKIIGLLIHVVLTIIDRFFVNIKDVIYIPIAIVGLILLIVGIVMDKKYTKKI